MSEPQRVLDELERKGVVQCTPEMAAELANLAVDDFADPRSYDTPLFNALSPCIDVSAFEDTRHG